MAHMLLFGHLADARRTRPRRFRLFNARLDDYLSENDVKSRFRFGRDSINYLVDLLSDDLARNTARYHALLPLVQVLVALCFFASGRGNRRYIQVTKIHSLTMHNFSITGSCTPPTYVHCLAG